MGLLRTADGALHALGARNLIGRGDECTLVLASPRASGTHASLTWRDGQWWLRDLGSTNGTTCDDVAVLPREPVSLGSGARLGFGGDGEHVLLESSPPGPVGVSDAGTIRAAEAGLLVLPDDEAAEALVYAAPTGTWVVERGLELGTLDGTLALSDARWHVHVPASLDGVETTWGRSATHEVGAVGLDFRVSQDEEHVDVTLRLGDRAIPLRSRVHHLLLLQLARTRLGDVERGLDEPEAGWVYADDLCRQLAIRPGVLSLHMLRARQQLAEVGVQDVGDLFTRRTLSGQLRLGLADLTVQSA